MSARSAPGCPILLIDCALLRTRVTLQLAGASLAPPMPAATREPDADVPGTVTDATATLVPDHDQAAAHDVHAGGCDELVEVDLAHALLSLPPGPSEGNHNSREQDGEPLPTFLKRCPVMTTKKQRQMRKNKEDGAVEPDHDELKLLSSPLPLHCPLISVVSTGGCAGAFCQVVYDLSMLIHHLHPALGAPRPHGCHGVPETRPRRAKTGKLGGQRRRQPRHSRTGPMSASRYAARTSAGEPWGARATHHSAKTHAKQPPHHTGEPKF